MFLDGVFDIPVVVNQFYINIWTVSAILMTALTLLDLEENGSILEFEELEEVNDDE